MIRPPPRSPLFPYTTLFRSAQHVIRSARHHQAGVEHRPERQELSGARRSEDVLQRRSIQVMPGRLAIERRSEEHTSELQSRLQLVCRLLLEKKNRIRFDIDVVIYKNLFYVLYSP